ncbi:hypothetical protein JHW43_009423 [Diplocarpon mali]|nr:hypothetical protein JHW43_009423 [Diplocarpon mali]
MKLSHQQDDGPGLEAPALAQGKPADDGDAGDGAGCWLLVAGVHAMLQEGRTPNFDLNLDLALALDSVRTTDDWKLGWLGSWREAQGGQVFGDEERSGQVNQGHEYIYIGPEQGKQASASSPSRGRIRDCLHGHRKARLLLPLTLCPPTNGEFRAGDDAQGKPRSVTCCIQITGLVGRSRPSFVGKDVVAPDLRLSSKTSSSLLLTCHHGLVLSASVENLGRSNFSTWSSGKEPCPSVTASSPWQLPDRHLVSRLQIAPISLNLSKSPLVSSCLLVSPANAVQLRLPTVPPVAVMIRLPPSAILIGHSDITDYEKRQQARSRGHGRESSIVASRYARIGISSRDNPDGDRSRKGPVPCRQIDLPTRLAHNGQAAQMTSHGGSLAMEESPQSRSHRSTSSQEISLSDLQGDELEYVAVGPARSPENAAHDSPLSSSSSKDDFYYGGFIETPGPSLEDDTWQSPFTPEDASATQPLQLPSSSRLRSRLGAQLPRSPLFLSQNASSSPERTTSLTPRVASRVANQNTPGIIFSQPPRRPPRSGASSTRAFRHQTNSFSFDSSERSSAAYEQERTVSSSTEGRSRGSDNVNLYEDLRGSSLQGSRNPSADSTDLVEIRKKSDGESDPGPVNSEHEEYGRTQFIFSSPQLSLPPPFSAVSRSVSRAESLPSSPSRDHSLNPLLSPIRSSSTTPVQAVERGYSVHAPTTAELFESSPPVRPPRST